MADHPHRPGDLLANKYRVVRPLSSGGMGEVLVATHEALGHEVAVKLIRSDMTDHPEALARFHREARASATMTSAHVARVFDVDTLQDGQPYIVMELLVGSPLDMYIAERGALPVAEAVGIVVQLLAGLAEAHSLGIVHRDLKPSNVFVVRREGEHDIVKILDFGISKMTSEVSDDGQDLTATEAILGTPAYMSPEQIVSSRQVDGRADVWSVGVMLYELLTGVCPFVGESAGGTFAKVLQMPVRAPRELRPQLPSKLDDVVMRCLERDRDDRYATVVELLGALSPFAAAELGHPLQHVLEHAATLPLAEGAARPSDETITNLTWGRRPRRRRAARSGLAVVIAVVAIAMSASLVRAPTVNEVSPIVVSLAAHAMVDLPIEEPEQTSPREEHPAAIPPTSSAQAPARETRAQQTRAAKPPTVNSARVVAPRANTQPPVTMKDELQLDTRQ